MGNVHMYKQLTTIYISILPNASFDNLFLNVSNRILYSFSHDDRHVRGVLRVRHVLRVRDVHRDLHQQRTCCRGQHRRGRLWRSEMKLTRRGLTFSTN